MPVYRDRGDDGALVALELGQPLGLQPLECLIHRDLADVEQSGNLVLPDRLLLAVCLASTAPTDKLIASDTPERAKTVGFSIPCFAFESAVVVNEKSGIASHEDMKGHVVGTAPWDTDPVALFTNREEYGFLNYLNRFVNQQVRTGRYAELYEKWIGGDLPELAISGVYR